MCSKDFTEKLLRYPTTQGFFDAMRQHRAKAAFSAIHKKSTTYDSG
jgi:hypothetical protein